MKTEEATKQVSIRPFIEALGYSTNDLTEVEPEYIADARTSGGERVDYAIMRDGNPIIFIEAKAANIPLSENHWKQLHHYFNAEEVRFGILTNGLEYRFYTDLKKRNIMDKQPYLVIDMLNLDGRLITELEAFTKTGFDAERILASAQKMAILRSLQKEIAQPSDALVKHFGSQVHSGRLSNSDIQRYARLVKDVWRELVEREIANRMQPSLTEDDGENDDVPMPQVSSDVVEVPVFASHKGQRFQATLLVDEIMNWHKKAVMVRFEGELMTHAAATKKAVRSTNPDRKTRKSGQRFWHFSHPVTGEKRPIEVIFKDVQEGGPLRRQFVTKYT